MGTSARKLLNSADGKDHVVLYNLHTDNGRDLYPDKKTIHYVLEQIGQKATANDILLVFFAGHGVVTNDEQKQFYFLAADASQATATSAAVAEVGISTAELSNWIQPSRIKAQKRILILDACNSGRALQQLVQIGRKEQHYVVARDDSKAQQAKAIDELNDKSGLFILAASASNKEAYEMSRYAQGLLTYALLESMKEQPDILEDHQYLSVGRWFAAAEKTVAALAQQNDERQQPQVLSTTNFNIGRVDAEVRASIVLPQAKTEFATSNFQNQDINVGGDDLGLTDQVNSQLREMSRAGTASKLLFWEGPPSGEAYTLAGNYTQKGMQLTVTANLWQNHKNIHHYQVSGSSDKLIELTNQLIERAITWLAINPTPPK